MTEYRIARISNIVIPFKTVADFHNGFFYSKLQPYQLLICRRSNFDKSHSSHFFFFFTLKIFFLRKRYKYKIIMYKKNGNMLLKTCVPNLNLFIFIVSIVSVSSFRESCFQRNYQTPQAFKSFSVSRKITRCASFSFSVLHLSLYLWICRGKVVALLPLTQLAWHVELAIVSQLVVIVPIVVAAVEHLSSYLHHLLHHRLVSL